MEKKICAFTGHRQIKREHKVYIEQMLARAVNYAYGRGCTEFYTGGAIGFDTLAALEVLKYKKSHTDVRLVLILPCRDQSKNWSRAQKSEYDYVIKYADEVRYVSDSYYDGCIRERNFRLIENAEILIAYVCRSNSGSAQTMRMANARGIDIYNIYGKLDEM